jgi:DNA-binding transcriptional LysR family regulator
MDTLHRMRVFVRVAKASSYTSAADQLNITTASASRAVSDLEVHLRARLLNRTTRRLALTEAGHRYLRRCEQILASVDQAEGEARGAHENPSGKLRIHAMTSLGQHYVVGAVGRYQQRHPSVQVELTLAQGIPDLLDEGCDVALALATDLPDSRLVAQRIGSAFSIVCATPAYLEKHGVPKAPGDLKLQTCVQLITPIFPVDEWVFDGPDGTERVSLDKANFQVNSSEGMAAAVREGMGIALLPIYSAISGLRSGALVSLLPGYTSHEITVFALYPSRKYVDAKISTWVDFVRDDLSFTLNDEMAQLRSLEHA